MLKHTFRKKQEKLVSGHVGDVYDGSVSSNVSGDFSVDTDLLKLKRSAHTDLEETPGCYQALNTTLQVSVHCTHTHTRTHGVRR